MWPRPHLTQTWLINLCSTAEGAGRKTTDQFVFVEKLDKRGGDKGVESLQEGVYLGLDGSRHPQLRHQLDVLGLREDTHTHQSLQEIVMEQRERHAPVSTVLCFTRQCHLLQHCTF